MSDNNAGSQQNNNERTEQPTGVKVRLKIFSNIQRGK